MHASIRLHVFPDDVLEQGNAQKLADNVAQRFGVAATLLDHGRACAINYTNTPVIEGGNSENLADVERMSEIYRFFQSHLRPNSPLSLNLPCKKYSTYAKLPAAETRHDKYLSMEVFGRSMPSTNWTMIFRTHAPKMPTRVAKRLADILEEWISDCCSSETLGGENIYKGDMHIVDSAGQLTVQCAARSAFVTFPWLDLYFRMRNVAEVRNSVSSIQSAPNYKSVLPK